MARKRKRSSWYGRNAHSGTRNQGGNAGGFAAGGRSIDFATVNAVALENLSALAARWLPDGRREGREWVALNPRRNDRSPGSFRINLQTGKWADFATDDARGGDPVSLAAYLLGASQGEAARSLAAMLGVGK